MLQPSFPHADGRKHSQPSSSRVWRGGTVQPNSARPRSLTAVCQWSKYMYTHACVVSVTVEREKLSSAQAQLIPHLSRKPEQHSCHLSPSLKKSMQLPLVLESFCSGVWSSRCACMHVCTDHTVRRVFLVFANFKMHLYIR